MSDAAPTIKAALDLQAKTIRQTLREERDRLLRDRDALTGQIEGLNRALELIEGTDDADA